MVRTLIVIFVLWAVADGKTKFESCSFLGSDRKTLCFKTVLELITVGIGDDGTNDDVTIQICSDKEASQCCTTPALKRSFRDDWSKNDIEKWDEDRLGKCKNKVFTVKRGLRVTLIKSNDDSLFVRNITIDTRSPDRKIVEKERFMCGNFELNQRNNGRASDLCKTAPYQHQRVFSATATMGRGATDGTDDDVSIKICSDINSNNCCTKKLSHTIKDDWRRGKTETWDRDQFGKCASELFKVKEEPLVSLMKDGSDDLVVSGFNMTFEVIDIPTNKMVTYSCPPFEIKNACGGNQEFCTHPFRKCKISSANVPTSASSGSFLGSLFGRK